MPFRIGMTVNSVNHREIENMADFCFQVGAKTVGFSSYVDFPENSSLSLSIGRKEYFAAARKVNTLRERFQEGFISCNFHENLKFLLPSQKGTAEDTRFVRCGLGATQLILLSNGDVIPCTYMRDLVLGNVLETHLSEIPDSPRFQKFKALRQMTVDEANETCRACEWKYVCGGGCRGQAYLLCGDLLAPDPRRCFLVKGESYDNTRI